MSKCHQSWYQKLRSAIKTGDADTTAELMQNAPRAITGDADDHPGIINININLPPQQPLPLEAKISAEPTADDSEVVPSYIKTIIARLDKLEGRTGGSDQDGDAGDEDDETEEKATGDAAYQAELIQPGINLDRKMKATDFKRDVLASADQALVRQIVGDADIRKMNRPTVDMAFNAVAELAKSRNLSVRTADAQRSTASTIEAMNARHREFWEKRSK
ncbi:hypothetical protein SODG_007596 [Sodalis praecaptivus]